MKTVVVSDGHNESIVSVNQIVAVSSKPHTYAGLGNLEPIKSEILLTGGHKLLCVEPLNTIWERICKATP